MFDIQWRISTGPCKMYAEGQSIPCPGGTGEADRAMYILLTGRVDVYKAARTGLASASGGAQLAGSLLPGEVFGGREYFTDADDFVYSAGLDSVVFVINRDSFNDLSWSRPEILFEVLRSSYMPLRQLSAIELARMNSRKSQPAASDKAAGDAAAGSAGAAGVSGSAGAAGVSGAVGAAGASGVVGSAGASGAAATAGAQGGAAGASSAAGASAANVAPGAPVASAAEGLPFFAARDGVFPEGHKGFPGVVRPEYLKLVFKKDYVCPFCAKPFEDYKIFRSKLYESKPMRYDLRRFYTDFMVEWYDVITCSNCLFSTFSSYFTEPKPLQKSEFEAGLAAARSDVHLDFATERDADFVFASYYLALLCAPGYMPISGQIKAKLWGNLSWLYEDLGDDGMMRFAASNAAREYEAIYAGTHLTTVQEQITCLSIAGMQHRAGENRDLKKYLFTAKTIKLGDKSYAKLAEDFMYEILES